MFLPATSPVHFLKASFTVTSAVILTKKLILQNKAVGS